MDFVGLIEGCLIVASICPIYALGLFIRDVCDPKRRKNIKVIWFEWLVGDDNCDCDDCEKKRRRWTFT